MCLEGNGLCLDEGVSGGMGGVWGNGVCLVEGVSGGMGCV